MKNYKQKEKDLIDNFKSIDINNIIHVVLNESMFSLEQDYDSKSMLYIPRNSLNQSEFDFLDSILILDNESGEFIYQENNSSQNNTKINLMRESTRKNAIEKIQEEYLIQKNDVLEIEKNRKEIIKKIKKIKDSKNHERYKKYIESQLPDIKEVFKEIDKRNTEKIIFENNAIDYEKIIINEKETIKDFIKNTKEKSQKVLEYLKINDNDNTPQFRTKI